MHMHRYSHTRLHGTYTDISKADPQRNAFCICICKKQKKLIKLRTFRPRLYPVRRGGRPIVISEFAALIVEWICQSDNLICIIFENHAKFGNFENVCEREGPEEDCSLPARCTIYMGINNKMNRDQFNTPLFIYCYYHYYYY